MNRASLRIVMISSEVESLARTGGLGDAVEALSYELARSGADVVLVTPRYGVSHVPPNARYWADPIHVRVGAEARTLGVLESEALGETSASRGRLRVCLVEEHALFGRDGIYGDRHGSFGDNDLRFAVLSRGALAVAETIWNGPADVVHAHDWHAALSVAYARYTMGEAWAKVPTVFTIHNLAHQGVFGEEALSRLGIPRDLFRSDAFERFGQLNLMKGAIALADRLTTVSPTYAREILTPEFGFGLDDLLRARREALVGIVNGIDIRRLDPETDPALAANYNAETADAGRAANKAALMAEFGLADLTRPLVGIVSRLTGQKGIDLFLDQVPGLVRDGANVVLVGQGDANLEHRSQRAAVEHPGRVGVKIAFEPDLARRVCAGADFFAVPSRFEPCGLTQMYAMRYGAVPIVSRVGGLVDTVTPIDGTGSSGTGILADAGSAEALQLALEQALDLYRDPGAMRQVRARGLGSDFSWSASARRYLELFTRLVPPTS